MARISISDLYLGEGLGEKYGGILNAVMRELFSSGVPEGCDERTWIELLTINSHGNAYGRTRRRGIGIDRCSVAFLYRKGGRGMSMLEEIWTCGLTYKDRPVKSGSPLERTLCL